MQTNVEITSLIIGVLLLTSFVKFLTTLTIVKQGLGLQSTGLSVVFTAFAFVLALLAAPGSALLTVEKVNGSTGASMPIDEKTTDYLLTHTDGTVLDKLKYVNGRAPGEFRPLVAAFLVTQLREAFQLGLMLLIPFILVDVLVANLFALLGVTQLPVQLVSLGLKLLLFVSVDGWALLAEKLLKVTMP